MSKNVKTALMEILLALALLLMVLLASDPAFAASTEDQAQTNTESGVDAEYPAAQQFTAGRSGSLDRVSIPMSLAISRNVGDLRLTVQSLNSAAATDTSSNPLDADPKRAGKQGKTWTFTTGNR